jgi:hypothetical protein
MSSSDASHDAEAPGAQMLAWACINVSLCGFFMCAVCGGYTATSTGTIEVCSCLRNESICDDAAAAAIDTAASLL